MTCRRKPNIIGLSLIEVMISLAIFSFVLLALAGLFPFLFKLNLNSWNSTLVMTLAQEKMNEILATNSFIDTTPSTDHPDSLPSSDSYRKWWGEPDPMGNPEIQIVNVEVLWKERGRSKIYRFTSAVCP